MTRMMTRADIREQRIASVRNMEEAAHACGIIERAKAGRSVRAATAADYARVGRARIDLDDETCGRLLEGVSRQSWDHHRTALRHETARLFSEHRTACEQAQRAEDLAAVAHHAKAAYRALLAFTIVTESEKPATRSAPRKSKRRVLPRDDAWQLRAWQAATPAMRGALAAGMVGARPREIELGVDVWWWSWDGERYLRVRIRGAKVTERSGQPTRELLIASDSMEGRALLAAIPDGQDGTTIQRRAKRISLDWSQRIRPAIGGKPSAYSLRHQFAANLKASRFDPVQIAAALGHLSVHSQGRYGSAQQAQGRTCPVLDIMADRDVVTGPQAAQIRDPDFRDPVIEDPDR